MGRLKLGDFAKQFHREMEQRSRLQNSNSIACFFSIFCMFAETVCDEENPFF